MKKIRLPNSYGDTTPRYAMLMHGLMLRRQGYFVWTNLVWFCAATYFFTREWLLLFPASILAFIFLMRLMDDHEFVDREKPLENK